ncbi:TBC domain-containing protein kinase-like protein [Rhopilema esculentum]|uniref:TBC domain-containing protein kinase-like protein n=1 Tax=Rhopilema esculentum TaxID=499914 RepID=UPI0031D58541
MPTMQQGYLDRASIGITTFFASAHPTDTCGTNGLPLTPNSVRILGKFQKLKLLKHENICQYVDLIRGKHERVVVAAEHYEDCLADHFKQGDISSLVALQKVAFSILQALKYLHSHNITVRNLSPENIQVTPENNFKISKYGMYYVTSFGSSVAFPIGNPCYLAPEVVACGTRFSPAHGPSSYSSDIWSLGMVLLDLYSLGGLWCADKMRVGNVLHKLLKIHFNCDSKDALEHILEYSGAHSRLKGMDRSLVSFLRMCLILDPALRPTAKELLKHEFLHSLMSQERHTPHAKDVTMNGSEVFPAVFRSPFLDSPDYNKLLSDLSEVQDEDHLSRRPIDEVYYLWTLAGGDVIAELKKNDLLKSKPPVLSLPTATLNNGEAFGPEKERERMLDETTVAISLDKLRMKLQNIDESAFYPLIVEDDLNPPDLTETAKLPLVIREKDVVYQFHRVILFDRLLEGYPFTRDRIIKEARIDIPPPFRAKVWAALLNIQGDVQEVYDRIDKESVTSTDRQIEVDIPRCHQYDQLLSSPAAHAKFKRVLKAWVVSHPKLTYWQGLDSLSAPFISLNFKNEALAFASMSAFIPKYLYNFFLKDNSPVIQEYLAVFSQMVAYHEPELFTHLSDIGFAPELYAIPWFLTMFSHVFPLHKIYYLWDTLLLGSSLLPLCIGVAILQQVRDQLISFGFNECILLFSDMPGIDIERTVKDSIRIFNHTPPSIGLRRCDNPANRTKAPEEEKFMQLPDKEFLPLEQLKSEVCPRISPRDLVRIASIVQSQDCSNKYDVKETKKKSTKAEKQTPKLEARLGKMLIVDVRPVEEYIAGHFPNSINVPYEQAFAPNGELSSSNSCIILQKHLGKIIMVVGNKGPDAPEFGAKLVRLGFRRVSVMDGSLTILKANGYFTSE